MTSVPSADAVADGGTSGEARVSQPVARKSMSHKNPSMVDVDTPHYIGYSKRLKAYHLQVTGRWRVACDDKYCWPRVSVDGGGGDIGSNDGVRIKFSDAVEFRKFAIRSYDVCGTVFGRSAKRTSSGDFETAFAGVNDEVYPGWSIIHASGPGGGSDSDKGTCKRSTMPTSTYVAGGGGGSASITQWADMKARGFRYDVWVNPLPSQGRCYDRLYVNGGYTHTWNSQSLTWSVGLGYPWSIGVGVGVDENEGNFTVWQNTDGYPHDKSLKTPRMCHHTAG